MIMVTVTTSSLEYTAHHLATCSTSLPHPFPGGWRWVASKASPDLPSSLLPCLVQLPCFIQAWFYFQIPIIQLWVIWETDEPRLFPQCPTLPFRLLCKLCCLLVFHVSFIISSQRILLITQTKCTLTHSPNTVTSSYLVLFQHLTCCGLVLQMSTQMFWAINNC